MCDMQYNNIIIYFAFDFVFSERLQSNNLVAKKLTQVAKKT